MTGHFQRHWPLLLTLVLLSVAVAASLKLLLGNTGGRLIYVLDDPYIHMAIAKNFSQKGVWGVTGSGFTSNSSSLLWTALLSAVYYFTSPNEVTPFVINIIVCTALVFWLYRLLLKHQLHSVYLFFVLMVITFVTSFPLLIFAGLEHTLQVLINFVFVVSAARFLSEDRKHPADKAIMLVLAPVLVLVRYEGLFLVFTVCCLLLLRRKYGLAFWIFGLALFPLACYGAFSMWKGWFIFPNSVLLKGNISLFTAEYSPREIIKKIVQSYYKLALHTPLLILILCALGSLYIRLKDRSSLKQYSAILWIIFLITALLHMQFAQVGGFFRYEAYLVALGLYAVGISLPGTVGQELQLLLQRRQYLRVFILTAVFVTAFSPLFLRALRTFIWIAPAAKNIYEQQYQMAKFISRYYAGNTLAANDIGAINYFADIDCLDIFGLGSLEVAGLRLSGGYNAESLGKLARTKKARIAVVYEKWLEKLAGIPPDWIKVGNWRILRNVTCGDETVTFYAIGLAEEKALSANLREFSSLLPDDVVESGKYIY